ncbi:PQQ-binding-like beta-propeller repeat protein [Parabacteroides chongii]|uniref:outer membrane protein assembly factor BamB family protein n=1 Tax=Parabacteroides chongii TaxID=2685834 RepID=UPI00240E0A80|nr:PQQ-binding-like beta-propeller repeat protein [Parabacteroides chongii]WFE86024.1 PQQ-binding-like beta-propeller repeat protein [Parabacteroides chongii]
MKKTFLNIALLSCVAFSASAAYTGRVFVDKNNNGVFDKGEKPMAGVAVSDGLNVVKTTSDGSFSLPGHPRERFIFITTPSGYKTDNKHYIRIDGEQKAYEFGLQPYSGGIKKDGSHKYVHIADTEIFNTENHGDWVNNVRDYAANEQVAFIMHTGDICYEKGLKAHIQIMNTANMDCPMFYAIGNHDLVKGKYGEELFENIYGPVYYSFDAGSTHYIVTPMAGGDHQPGYTKEDVYRWLKNDLAQVPQGKPVVVFNHDLLTYGDQFIFGINDQEQINLNEHNLKAWVYGHWHINYMKKQGDVYSISTATLDKGGIDHSTSAFRVLHVDKKGDFVSELRYTYLDKQIQIASPVEGQVPVLASGAVPLAVNAYSSVTPVKEVTYTCLVDGKALFNNKKLQQATDWCWNAEVPLTAKQEGKAVTLKIKARFNNGETAETESAFTYHAAPAKVELGGNWLNLLENPQHAAPAGPALNQPLQMAWIKNVGANIYMTSPLVYNGKIYIASVDENLKGEAHVYALDGKTGELIWKYPVRNSIKNTIVIDNGQVLAQDAQGYLYAINAESGKLSWEKQLPVNGLPALIEGLVASDGIVYAGTGKGLCAIETKDGKVLWQNKDWGQGEGTTTTFSVAGDKLIGSSQWNALYGNDLKTGALKWTANTNGLRNRGASAAVHGNLLYLISDKSFFILEANTGRVIVRKELPFSVDVTSTPLLTDKEIIFGSAKDGLIALDNETLELKWKFATGDALVFTSPYSRKPAATIETSPVLAGNTVYVGASDGTIYGVNKEDGKLVWKHATGAPVFGSVTVSGNALIAVDFGGNVYTFVAGN